jgi:hypothetical protein
MLATTTAVAVISEMPCARVVLMGAMATRGAGERQLCLRPFRSSQRRTCAARKRAFIFPMKTISSHLTRGVIIAVSLLVLSQAWRLGRQPEADQVPEKVMAELKQELHRMDAPPPRPVMPSQSSLEFGDKWERPHNPWKDPTDPDKVWHDQRQRASQLLLKNKREFIFRRGVGGHGAVNRAGLPSVYDRCLPALESSVTPPWETPLRPGRVLNCRFTLQAASPKRPQARSPCSSDSGHAAPAASTPTRLRLPHHHLAGGRLRLRCHHAGEFFTASPTALLVMQCLERQGSSTARSSTASPRPSTCPPHR